MTLCSGRRLRLTACLGLALSHPPGKEKNGTVRAVRISVGGAAMAVIAYLRAVAGRSRSLWDSTIVDLPGATGGVRNRLLAINGSVASWGRCQR